jgi:hypothetical protein
MLFRQDAKLPVIASISAIAEEANKKRRAIALRRIILTKPLEGLK